MESHSYGLVRNLFKSELHSFSLSFGLIRNLKSGSSGKKIKKNKFGKKIAKGKITLELAHSYSSSFYFHHPSGMQLVFNILMFT
jgi:hypothetical protein